MTKHGGSLGEPKTHFKMYKKGRNWMVAGVTVATISLGIFSLGSVSAQADTADDAAGSTTSETAPNAAVTTASSVALKSSQLASETTNSATTGEAATEGQSTDVAGSTDATGSATSTTAASQATETTPVSATANSATTSETGATNSTTNQAVTATTNEPATSQVSTDLTPTATQPANVAVHHLGSADATELAAAKAAAKAEYEKTGIAQTITAADSSNTYESQGYLTTASPDFIINETPSINDYADGMSGTSRWELTNDGVLHIETGELGSTTATKQSETDPTDRTTVSNWAIYADYVNTINFEGPVSLPDDASSIFSGMSVLTTITNLDRLDTSKTTKFDNLWSHDPYLTEFDASSFDMSNATSIKEMFKNDYLLKSLNVGNWDVSHVTDFEGAFQSLESLTNLDVNQWVVSAGTNFNRLFNGAGMTTLDLSNWQTNATASTDDMFYDMSNLGKITFGPGFALTPLMPIQVARDKYQPHTYVWQQNSNWIGLGTGTQEAPTGTKLVNTTYSGVPDTYVWFVDDNGVMKTALTTATFNYVDQDTGEIVKTDTMVNAPDTWTSYYPSIPTGYYSIDVPPISQGFRYAPDNGTVFNYTVAKSSPTTITLPLLTTVQTTDGTVIHQQKDVITNEAFAHDESGTQMVTEIVSTATENGTNGTFVDVIPAGYELVSINVKKDSPAMGTSDVTYNFKTGIGESKIHSLATADTPATTHDLKDLYIQLGYDEQGFYTDVRNGIMRMINVKGDTYTTTMVTNAVNLLGLNLTNETVVFTVEALPQTGVVQYVDHITGDVVATDSISGVTDETGTYQTVVPDGYVLTDGQDSAVAYKLTADHFVPMTIKLSRVLQTPDESAVQTTLTVHYVDQNGNPVAPDSVTTGQIGTPYSVTSPTGGNYTLVNPAQATLAGKYVGNAMTATVVYQTVAPSDGGATTGGETTPGETTTPDEGNVPGGTVNTGDNNTPTGPTTTEQAPSTVATPQATAPTNGATGEVTTGNDTSSSESQAATAPENEAVVGENDTTNSASQFSNAAVKGTDADGTATANDASQTTSAQLPQTDETTQTTSLLGLILLSVTGMLGLAGKRRRD